MAYGDIRYGCRPFVLAATVAGHCVLLAVAASAIHGSSPHTDREAGALVALFESAPPKPAAAKPRATTPTASPREQVLSPAQAPGRSSPTVSGGGKPIAVDLGLAAEAQPAAPPLELPGGETQPLPPEPARPLPAATGETDALSHYVGVLRSAIAARIPRGLRKEGEVMVAFRLDRNGRLAGAEIARPSGDVQLDRLALRMVRQAAPFPPPDAAIPEERLSFTIPVRFH